MKSDPALIRLINNLTPAQKRVFSAICMNDSQGHHPRTLKALMEKGLVQRIDIKDGMFTWYDYDFADYAVHMAWCEWAASQPEDVDQEVEDY